MKDKNSKNDLSEKDVENFRKMEKIFLERCKHFGYREIKTSTIAKQYIFTARDVLSSKYADRMVDFFDKAEGWGGEPVVLRPDSSSCVARLYNERLRVSPKDVKRKFCYVENQFLLTDSKDAVSERWQCGVENLGQRDPDSAEEAVLCDIESLYMAHDIIAAIVRTDFHLILSYPSMLRELAAILSPESRKGACDGSGITACLKKVSGKEGLPDFLAVKGESVNYLHTLGETFRDEKFGAIMPKLDNFTEICRMLDELAIPYLIDFSQPEDFDYYTGIRFQIQSAPNAGDNGGILCAGGRYDNLASSMYDNLYDEKPPGCASIPATGFALYVKNILKTLPAADPCHQNVVVFMEKPTSENMKTATGLCSKLTDLGFSARIDFTRQEPEESAMVLEVSQRHKGRWRIKSGGEMSRAILMKMTGACDE